MSWRAVVSAVDEHAAVRSRVSVYLHPLGGRPILWHVLRAVLDTDPPPDEVVVVHRPGGAIEAERDEGASPVRYEQAAGDDPLAALRSALAVPGVAVVIDAAAPLLSSATLARLARAGAAGTADVRSEDGPPVAAAGDARALAAADDPRVPPGSTAVPVVDPDELLRVTDRATLGRAGVALRDRLVRAHELRGVSFLLPETTWLDVDVRIGRDTVIYPGCILEGATEIGDECVIGPHSRVIDATIGRGVELRGWNYLCRTHVRNRAVLEPFARRGGE